MESPHTPDPPRDDQPAPPPPPPGGPQAPSGAPQAPPPPPGPQAPEAPAGGWEQPIAQQESGWAGKPLAGWGTRLAATLIDWVILIIPVGVITAIVVAAATSSDTAGWVSGVIGFLAYLVVAFLYAPLLMARDGARNGQTWGKQLMNIRVARDSGERIGFGWGALREIAVKGLLVGIASSIIPVIPWILNYFWPLWDDQNRALHDMVVSSHVVRA
jgi:uncharacterized RDD family membrane protein YckC